MKRIFMPILYFFLTSLGFTAIILFGIFIWQGILDFQTTPPGEFIISQGPRSLLLSLIPGASLGLASQFYRFSRKPAFRYPAAGLLILTGAALLTTLFSLLFPLLENQSLTNPREKTVLHSQQIQVLENGNALWFQTREGQSISSLYTYENHRLNFFPSGRIQNNTLERPDYPSLNITPSNPQVAFLTEGPIGSGYFTSLYLTIAEFFLQQLQKSRINCFLAMIIYGIFLFSINSFSHLTPWPFGNFLTGIILYMAALFGLFHFLETNSQLLLIIMGSVGAGLLLWDIIQSSHYKDTI